ncbi:hypothetical protein AN640_02810 [Candidatus Epulonipiscium fishelsonii]|uniref:Uncharacterized protein n=1 Tax=Candidatus Epulonipiscium fishelsonii TaxID=77094 RepID=A0ACC8X882_9FIRM|nr:hypothetical protein AN640_02810 [Epulopiscium sp. SCG-D08WGA-EpuloA1]OON90501.1 MAG: hypothetical protein ATN32_03800 [Epulopiscium sp. AS2M-Bin002]
MLKTDELLAIAYHLVRGIDPYTNEKLGKDHLINNKHVYQLLTIAQNSILISESRNSIAKCSELPPHTGKPWSNEEDTQLVTEYENKTSIKKIAKLHGRTSVSIMARLNKIYPHLYKNYSSESFEKNLTT